MAPRKTKRTNRTRKNKNKNKAKKTQKRIRFLLQKGGTAGTAGTAAASYIPFETTPGQYILPQSAQYIGAAADPSDPSNIVSVRMQPNMVGGKRTKRTRKIRGGADPITEPQTSNAIYSFLTTQGTQLSADIMNGVPLNQANNAFRPLTII